MRCRTFVASGFLVAIAACSASGAVEDPGPPDAGESPGDARAPDVDAGPAEDATPGVDRDAERPLLCGDAGFCETRLPTSDLGLPLSLRSIWVVGSNDVWSVTLEGFVLHYDGTGWSVAYKANHELYAVWATPTSVWVGGEDGLLFHGSASGDWSLVESGHMVPIRAIYGTGDSDVWFTRFGGSVDHFDGTTLTHHFVEVPGLEITTVFGRPGFGTYAAGHVKATISPEEMVEYRRYILPDQPYVYELSTAKISAFNTSLTETRGFVPVSGVVTDSPNEDQRIFLVGYEHSKMLASGIVFHNAPTKCASFGAGTSVVPTIYYSQDIPFSSELEAATRPVPVLAYKGDDLRVMFKSGFSLRWDGSGFKTESLAMGYDYGSKFIMGAHNDATHTWMVGDGFALKGTNP